MANTDFPGYWEEPPPEDSLPDPMDVEIVDDRAPRIRRDPNTGAMEIDFEDGSVLVDMDPVGEAYGSEEHDENLAEIIEESELARIADELLQGIEADDRSRQEWLQQRADGIKLLGIQLEDPKGSLDGAALEGMSSVRHPLLLEAVLRFQANASGELLPANGPVKVKNDGEQTEETDRQAEALEEDLNHYLTTTASEYYPDTDRMLLMVGFGGMMFKKVYDCPLRRRPVSESVDAKNLIVSNAATDLKNSGRYTHQISMRPSIMKRMQLVGAYRNIELGQPVAQPDVVDTQVAEQQGVASQKPELPQDTDYTVYECYAELDIEGFEHMEDGEPTGLPLPYRVSIDKTSRQILAIHRNWEEGDDTFEAKETFVEFRFVPGFGFYALGLLHILGNPTTALTALWREMIDAGMFANFPGFLYAKNGARQMDNNFRVPPGGGAQIDTGGMPVRDAVMPLPYKEPGPAIMNLTTHIADTGQRLGGTANVGVGEGKQDAPVGTTLALIEQATKVEGAVHKRLHTAQAKEFQLLKKLFRADPEALWRHRGQKIIPHKWNAETVIAALDNYDIVPVADPNTPSHMHRLMKAMAIKQLQGMNPDMYDPVKVDTRVLHMINVDDPETLFAPPKPPPGPNPEFLVKQIELYLKGREIGVKEAKVMIDAKNADADRESKENIAIMELADAIANNPRSLPEVNRLLTNPRLPN